MNRTAVVGLGLRQAVDGLADDVEEPAANRLADGHRNLRPGVPHGRAARQAVGRVHGDRADPVLAEVLLHFEHERRAVGLVDFERVQDLGKRAVGKSDIDDGADDLHYLSVGCGTHGVYACEWAACGPGPGLPGAWNQSGRRSGKTRTRAHRSIVRRRLPKRPGALGIRKITRPRRTCAGYNASEPGEITKNEGICPLAPCAPP